MAMIPIRDYFGRLSSVGRSLTRWSARTLTASFLLVGLTAVPVAPGNLFNSLASQLRDAVICVTRVPQWVSILLLAIGFRVIAGALWSSMHKQLTPDADSIDNKVADLRRGMVANRPIIYGMWRNPAFRPIRRRLIWGAFIWAVLSGVVSTVFTALVLMWLRLPPVLIWLLIVVASTAINKVEWMLTEQRYSMHASKPEPPAPAEIALRRAAYEMGYPKEAHMATPLIYAYSRLDREQIKRRMMELSVTPSATWAPRMAAVALVAAIYPAVPAPNISSLGVDNSIGCFYANFYGFFRIDQDNMQLAIAATVILLLIHPLLIQLVYVKLMQEWQVPTKVQGQALYRDRRVFIGMIPVAIIGGVFRALVAILALLASAVTATWLQSSLAGLAVLVLPQFAGVIILRRIYRGSK